MEMKKKMFKIGKWSAENIRCCFWDGVMLVVHTDWGRYVKICFLCHRFMCTSLYDDSLIFYILPLSILFLYLYFIYNLFCYCCYTPDILIATTMRQQTDYFIGFEFIYITKR